MSLIDQPTSGAVEVNPDGTIDYTHDGSASSTDSFSYTVDDNEGATSNTATVNLTIDGTGGANQAPVANDDNATVTPGELIAINVLGNDSDSDGQLAPATVSLIDQPASGAVEVNPDGTIDYTHDGSASSTDSFSYTVNDNEGAISNTATVNLTISDPSMLFISDDFNNASLGSQWTLVNPKGDGTLDLTGVGTGDALLELTVPAGTHDLWRSKKDAIRTMQSSANEDFEAEVKFESEPSQRFQLQGILVDQDADNWIRFDTYHDGSQLRVFAATTTNGSSQTKINVPVASGTASHLRVNRQGDEWTLEYSADGNNWNTAGSFTHSLNVSEIGTFAGNAQNAPAFTAEVDYFFNTASPIVPEDGGLPSGENQAPIANDDNGTVAPGDLIAINVLGNDSDSDGQLDPATVSLIDQPASGAVEVNPDGTIDYTHDGSASSTDSFSYTVE